VGQFGIGQAVRRKEDVRFITGTGRFTDDMHRPNEAHAVFVRSPHAHAVLRRVDAENARRAPGVLGVFTGEDVARAGLGLIKCVVPLKNRDGSDYANLGRPLLARGRVRHVGEPVAMVVAETLAAAKDAAELVDADYEPLPVVTDPAAAARPGAPKLHERGNIALDWELGDAKAVAAAFAKAARTVSVDLGISRMIVTPLEPRSVVGEYDKGSGRFTVHLGTQGVFSVRATIAKNLAIPEDKLRVVTPDVGGSFGMKGFDYPEHSLVPWAAKELGRPVRWTSDRQEAFLSDTQGREQQVHAELALDQDARFLAIRAETFANVGAYLSYFSLLIPTVAGFRLLTGAYRIPAAHVHVRACYTNTVWVDAYRGAGRPECAYILERLVDAAARETGLGPDEIRRRNFIPPSAMPYKTPMIVAYDSGDFARNLDSALAHADWKGFPRRREEALQRGKRRGIGIAYYMEVTANMPQEKADIRFGDDGRVAMRVGTGPTGQGHETAFAQILEDRLGLPFDRIDYITGDSDNLISGGGTGGAKSLMLAGTALLDAAERIIARGKRLAGHVLEAAEADIEFRDGNFSIAGTDRRIHILDLARRVKEMRALPADLPKSLDDVGASTANQNTFPNGCHVCEVEIDPDTGATTLCRYTVADDFGRIVNPLIVEGQIHGGVVQGLGQIFSEQAIYDPQSGQLLTGSLMDYALPRADDVPPVDVTFNEVPCTTNALGMKGAGEAGSVGSLAAAMNAVIDALAPLGVKALDMPATPARVWGAIKERARA
jgi:aerobic carbon-monoxide dehydrogenase large subunit